MLVYTRHERSGNNDELRIALKATPLLIHNCASLSLTLIPHRAMHISIDVFEPTHPFGQDYTEAAAADSVAQSAKQSQSYGGGNCRVESFLSRWVGMGSVECNCLCVGRLLCIQSIEEKLHDLQHFSGFM
jgi:hypothetical protein